MLRFNVGCNVVFGAKSLRNKKLGVNIARHLNGAKKPEIDSERAYFSNHSSNIGKEQDSAATGK